MNTDYNTPLRAVSSGYRLSEVPHFVQYVSPVPGRPATSSTAALPLGILVLIFNHLEDAGDLARVSRTSRLFRYVALPQLYEKVSIHSRSEIKYVDGRPQGFGGGSPFGMALNGLATQDYVTYTKELRIRGELDEPSNDNFAKGRVPDTTTMLSTILRIIVDRASRLESFIWELNAKPNKAFYQGLAARQSLIKLTLKFPNVRTPRPTVVIPPMPKLRLLKVINIDPRCYPDDLSMLMFQSRSLEDVRLHFSPRMRSEADPVVALQGIFSKCFSAGYVPRLKHFAMQNYFGRYFDEMTQIYDRTTLTSACYLDMFGGIRSSGSTIYVDDSWRNLPEELVSTVTSLRFNEPAPQHVRMLQNATTCLEKLYFVNDLTTHAAESPDTMITPGTSPSEGEAAINLGKEYIHVLTRKHGTTLKHLMLCDQWILSQQEVGDMVRFCPNLEQLALALDDSAMDVFRVVMQFLPRVYAIKVYDNETFRQERQNTPLEERIRSMGQMLARSEIYGVRYVGLGPEVFEVTGRQEIGLEDGTTKTVVNLMPVKPAQLQHIAIWGLDKLDIMSEASHVN